LVGKSTCKWKSLLADITLNHVSVIDIFNEHLPLADTCHVVGAMHLYRHCPLVRFSPPVHKRATSRSNNQCRRTHSHDSSKRLGVLLRQSHCRLYLQYLSHKPVVETVWKIFTSKFTDDIYWPFVRYTSYGNTAVDGMVILQWIAKKQGMMTWADLLGLLIGSSDCLVHGNKRFSSVIRIY
jgi:hypothetical protein